MKANKIAESLCGHNPERFWSLIKKQLGGSVPSPPSFGNVTGDDKIANMWRINFADIFNDLSCASDLRVLSHLSYNKSAVTPITTGS